LPGGFPKPYSLADAQFIDALAESLDDARAVLVGDDLWKR
jgi:hypothetical protein